MGVPRWPMLVGILAIGGGIAWFAVRDRAEPSRPSVDSPGTAAGPLSTTGSGKAAIFAPEGPRLGSGGGDPAAVAPIEAAKAPEIDAGPGRRQVAFAAQTRDPTWAATTEAEIKKRFRRAKGAKLEATSCRTDQCELTLAGSSDEVATTLAELESPRGLRGFAQSVVLTAPDQRDGKLVLRAYATFDRAAVVPPPPE